MHARPFWQKRMLKPLLILAAWALLPGGPGGVRAQSPTEYQVKAVFLSNFAKFIEWPPGPSRDLRDPFTICIVGQDPFGTVLDEAVQGKTISGHRLVVRRSKPGESWKGCQIAFISSSEGKDLPSVLESSQRSGVLTVGEIEGFAQRGGMINFVLEDNQVHFEINLGAAERAGIKISSKLLSLARIVKEQDYERKD